MGILEIAARHDPWNAARRRQAGRGHSAKVFFRRQAIVQADPNIEIEFLTHKSRIVNLGVLPASEPKSFNWPIAPSFARGTLLVAHAETTDASTAVIRRTSSVPAIVR